MSLPSCKYALAIHEGNIPVQNRKSDDRIQLIRVADPPIQLHHDICKRREPEDHGDKVDEQMQPREHHVQGAADIEDVPKCPGHDESSGTDDDGPCGTENSKRQDWRRVAVDSKGVPIVIFGDGAGIIGEDIASQAEFDNGEDDSNAEKYVEGKVEGMHVDSLAQCVQ